jgi:hypothetical protein
VNAIPCGTDGASVSGAGGGDVSQPVGATLIERFEDRLPERSTASICRRCDEHERRVKVFDGDDVAPT